MCEQWAPSPSQPLCVSVGGGTMLPVTPTLLISWVPVQVCCIYAHFTTHSPGDWVSLLYLHMVDSCLWWANAWLPISWLSVGHAHSVWLPIKTKKKKKLARHLSWLFLVSGCCGQHADVLPSGAKYIGIQGLDDARSVPIVSVTSQQQKTLDLCFVAVAVGLGPLDWITNRCTNH